MLKLVLITIFLGLGSGEPPRSKVSIEIDDFDEFLPKYMGVEPRNAANFALSGHRWQRNDLKWYYRHSSFPRIARFSSAEIRSQLSAAFSKWAEVTALNFEEVFSESEADMVVFMGRFSHHERCNSFDGPGKVLAHAYYPFNQARNSIAGDIHFDADESWTLSEEEAERTESIDLQTVAIHEIGHALGLRHSTVRGAIMLPAYFGPNRRLGTDDVSGIVEIYGSRATPNPAPGNKVWFKCINEKLVNPAYICDGDNDCGDNSDEINCFGCENGKEINPAYVCDNDNDCDDNSDERVCFNCNNGKIVKDAYRCDGDNDCGDNSDESQCDDDKPQFKNTFDCNNGKKINADYVCDGDNDCGDYSDEKICFFCNNGKKVKNAFKCDGDNDCGDNSDENNC